MDGALYFPMISVPETAWFVRMLLYWDVVGTIVPESFVDEPEELSPYTLELVRAGLLLQVLPSSSAGHMAAQFTRYISSLPREAIHKRQRAFASGHGVLIHRDKWLQMESGLREVVDLRLANRDSGRWTIVEPTTAAEFMSALALALCHPDSQQHWFDRRRHQFIERTATWVPATDSARTLEVLFSGLDYVDPDDEGARRTRRRIAAQRNVTEIRTSLLERMLPVPTVPVDVRVLARFRSRHERLLPDFRRHIEGLAETALQAPDEDARTRLLERAENDAKEMIERVEAYLAEGGMRRLARSNLLRAVRFAPAALGAPVGNAQDMAENMLDHPHFEQQPLAYLAFASHEFARTATYQSAPGQLSLADSMLLPL